MQSCKICIFHPEPQPILSKVSARREEDSNHPKQADYYMTFLLVNFAVKKRHV